MIFPIVLILIIVETLNDTWIVRLEELTLDNDGDCEKSEEECADKKNEESVVVANAYTVVDPWTMMVKALNAYVADRAVARTCRSYNKAIWA